MITGKEHSSGPVVVLPFFWAPLYANVGHDCTQHLCSFQNNMSGVEVGREESFCDMRNEVKFWNDISDVVEFKDLSHLMILIPAKMNSPDYEDFIDMFSVPTPISPLPPTPVASPSHEASEDVIYDSLPPWSNLPFPNHL
ncbi:hypothetical protein TNCV_1230321 [Trichonephila clavipes]|nr:hypothetical protein TNCV_1230321 [Trichonephila clavipes]